MVVYGHSGESFFLKPVYHIHLPIFLIISGYLMGSSNKWKNRSFQENMAKTASDLIYPYAVFGMISVIYRAISLPIQGYPPSDIVIYIRKVLLLDNDSNWFLPPLFFSKTLFTVLYHWMSRRKRRIIFVIGSSILGVDLFSKLYHIGLFRIFDGTMLFDNVYPCLAYLVLWLGRTLAFLVFLLIGFWLHGVLPRLNDQYTRLYIAGGLVILVAVMIYSLQVPMVNLFILQWDNTFLYFYISSLGAVSCLLVLSQWQPRCTILEKIGLATLMVNGFHGILETPRYSRELLILLFSESGYAKMPGTMCALLQTVIICTFIMGICVPVVQYKIPWLFSYSKTNDLLLNKKRGK